MNITITTVVWKAEGGRDGMEETGEREMESKRLASQRKEDMERKRWRRRDKVNIQRKKATRWWKEREKRK